MTWDIAGKRVLVTGGTTGIGRATVEELARRGADVVFTARRPEAGDRVVEETVATKPEARLAHRRLDLADLGSVRAFAESLVADFDRLDVLVNNAGVVMSERRETVDGFEMTFGVNHLGHFALVEALRPLLEASAPARVVIVASDAHRFSRGLDFDDLQSEKGRFGVVRGLSVYAASKLANLLHGRELSGRLPADRVTVNAVHPGGVRTRLGRDDEGSRVGEAVWSLAGRLMATPEKGARTSVWAVTAPELDGVTGRYFAKEAFATPKKTALDEGAAARLWSVSEELVAQ